ncbi:hypothetical protein BGZ88_005083 [Linnemannia elongata]|nr:hypothetical protein BGZ88_005083 [Linnemannia elongata]
MDREELREQEQQPEPPISQLQAQVAWGLEVLLRAAETIKAQDQTPAQATLSPSTQLQPPQSLETRPPELVLPTCELPPAAPIANIISYTSTAPPLSSPSTTKPKNKCKYKPKYKSDVWRPASGTGDGDTTTTSTKKRKDSENENDVPETPEVAEFLEDMNNPIGLALSTHGGYKSGFRRWREFCNNHKETYSGVDGRDLFLVNSEDKVVAFLVECYFSKTFKKHVRSGADLKTLVASDFDADGRSLPVDSNTLTKCKQAF